VSRHALEGEVFTEDLGEISVRARVRGSAPSE
jgi:hypothetical protein